MIYSVNESANTYTESMALFGYDADEFLESVEVALYEDSVAIGENVYDGAEAEAFLAENGIHLYDDHIVLEGKQAEEYKARKAKEKADANQKELDRWNHRYAPIGSTDYKYAKGFKDAPTGYKNTGANPNKSDRGIDEDRKRYRKTQHKVITDEANKEGYGKKEVKGYTQNYNYSGKPDGYYGTINNMVHDATDRHLRRHPKNESAIFDFELK